MDDYVSYYHDTVTNKPLMWKQHSRGKVFDSHTDEYIVKFIDFVAEAPKPFDLPSQCTKRPIKFDEVESGRKMLFAAEHLPLPGNFHAHVDDKKDALFSAFVAEHGLNFKDGAEWEDRKVEDFV